MSRGRDIFNRFKWAIELLVMFYRLFPRGVRVKILERHRRTRGVLGLGIRYALLKTLAAEIGNNVSISTDVYLFNIDRLRVGDNVSIHPMSYLDAYGEICIGSDVSIAHSVSILSFDHIYSQPSACIKDQPSEAKPITIESNVWIGARATILGNVVVRTGTIVAAGSVVTRSTDKNSIVAGVPAVIKKKY